MSRYFVTGATGCIGGWVVKNLIESGCDVYALLRDKSKLKILSLIMDTEDIEKINVIEGDISDLDLLKKELIESKASKIIHLAAMQLPLCKANPALGARTNVEGTINVFEAALAAGLRHLVYSSSTAVYGQASDYPDGIFDHDSPLIPSSLYGVYKQANEWQAKVYWQENQLSSMGLRPFVAYGPLRDRGMTSTPTAAIKAAVRGEEYEISFGGEFEFQYVDDVAKAFINAADKPNGGAQVLNIGGGSVGMVDIVAAISEVIPSSKGAITFKDITLPFPGHRDTQMMEKVLGFTARTPLLDGIKESVIYYRKALDAGKEI